MVQFSGSKQQQLQPNKNLKSLKIIPSAPDIKLHGPSSSSIKTAQKLPTFQSKTDQSTSDIQSNATSTNQITSSTLPFNQAGTGEPNSTSISPVHTMNIPVTIKASDETASVWDLDEINRFTREIFKQNSNNTGDLIS